jgi:hypothetical protein
VQDFTGAKLLESSTKPNSFIRFMFSSIRFLRISSYPTGLSSSTTPIVPVPKLPTPRPGKQNLDENLKVKITNSLFSPTQIFQAPQTTPILSARQQQTKEERGIFQEK